MGVFLPGVDADAWICKAFTSPQFEADPDVFRVIAWRNARVTEINAKERRWRYGDNIPTLFMPANTPWPARPSRWRATSRSIRMRRPG